MTRRMEGLYVGEDGGDIGAAESFSRRHPWEYGSLVLFQSSYNMTSSHNGPDFGDAGGFSDNNLFWIDPRM